MTDKTDRIQIEGRLADQAVVGVVANTQPPAYRLSMTVVPDRGLPYIVSQHLGTDRVAEQAARSKQRLLRRGAWVRVFAQHLMLRYDHGAHALMALGVTEVIPMEVPSARHDQEARDAG